MNTVPIKRYSGGKTVSQNDFVVMETRVSIRIGSRETVCLMALPEALDVLAIGYLYSEGYIDDISTIQSIRTSPQLGVVSIELSSSGEVDASAWAMPCIYGCSGGLSSIRERVIPGKISPGKNFSHRISSLLNAANRLSGASELFRVTGGVHSSGLWMEDDFLWIYDDIGRHNTVDKVIGRAVQQLWPIPETAVLVSTGRISSDIVNKAVRAGIRVLVSRSAPMGLAIRIAQEHGVTLVGFARNDTCNIYSHFERVDTK